jgi:hypothetical protein
VLEYAAQPNNAAPAWPMLHSGFLGAAPRDLPSGEQRLLGIDMPAGKRGGAVFDAYGQLAGIALAAGSADRWVPLSQLQAALLSKRIVQGTASQAATPPGPKPKAAADGVYESGLKTSLQLIAVSKP